MCYMNLYELLIGVGLEKLHMFMFQYEEFLNICASPQELFLLVIQDQSVQAGTGNLLKI